MRCFNLDAVGCRRLCGRVKQVGLTTQHAVTLWLPHLWVLQQCLAFLGCALENKGDRMVEVGDQLASVVADRSRFYLGLCARYSGLLSIASS